MSCNYKAFLVHDQQFQWSIPITEGIPKDFPSTSEQAPGGPSRRHRRPRPPLTLSPPHCSTRAAQNIEGHNRPVIADSFPQVFLKSPSKKRPSPKEDKARKTSVQPSLAWSASRFHPFHRTTPPSTTKRRRMRQGDEPPTTNPPLHTPSPPYLASVDLAR